MFSMSGNLLHLPRDLLLEILARCSIDDLLVAERVCRELHSLCRSREIWMSLIRNLDVHQAPTFAPYERLEVLSTNVIRNRVIRAVKTSLYSVKPESTRIRTIATFTLPQRALPDGLKFFSRMKPEVVAGGKYVIVENQGQIELWSIQDSERIWTSPGPGEPLYCHSFGSEIQQDGNILTIAAAYVDYLSGKSAVRVHQICLRSLESKEVSRRDVLLPFLAPITVRGDVIMIRHPIDYIIYLCNWKNGSAVALNFRVTNKTNTTYACLTDTHLLVILHIGAFTLLAIPLSALAKHWAPASSSCDIPGLDIHLATATADDPCPVDKNSLDLLRINLCQPRDSKNGPWVITMHSFTPEWRRVYGQDVPTEIYIVGLEKDGGVTSPDRLLSWRLQLSRTDACEARPKPIAQTTDSSRSWRVALVSKGCSKAPMLPWNAQTISNGGRMLSFHKGLHCFNLFNDEPQPTKLLQDNEKELVDRKACFSLESVDPYSGTLAIRTPSKVVIVEFE